MIQTLGAIGAAHELGIIHRDMKPANIMVLKRKDDEGELIDLVKVCDFGLAKMLNFDGSFDGMQTIPGAVIGTPVYMSPEQATGEHLSSQTDVYSCGVILYQMVAGRAPFVAENNMQVLMKHVSERPPPLEYARPGINPRLMQAIYWA